MYKIFEVSLPNQVLGGFNQCKKIIEVNLPNKAKDFFVAWVLKDVLFQLSSAVVEMIHFVGWILASNLKHFGVFLKMSLFENSQNLIF